MSRNKDNWKTWFRKIDNTFVRQKLHYDRISYRTDLFGLPAWDPWYVANAPNLNERGAANAFEDYLWQTARDDWYLTTARQYDEFFLACVSGRWPLPWDEVPLRILTSNRFYYEIDGFLIDAQVYAIRDQLENLILSANVSPRVLRAWYYKPDAPVGERLVRDEDLVGLLTEFVGVIMRKMSELEDWAYMDLEARAYAGEPPQLDIPDRVLKLTARGHTFED